MFLLALLTLNTLNSTRKRGALRYFNDAVILLEATVASDGVGSDERVTVLFDPTGNVDIVFVLVIDDVVASKQPKIVYKRIGYNDYSRIFKNSTAHEHDVFGL